MLLRLPLVVLCVVVAVATARAAAAPDAPYGSHGDIPFAAALQALDAWQLEDAVAAAAAALRAAPDAAPAQALAAEVLHQRGQHALALRLANAAAQSTQLQAALRARLLQLLPQLAASAAASRSFACQETGHFRLCFADKDAIVAHYAEEVLEAAYLAISRALAFAPAERGEKIVVEFYRSAAELASATGLEARNIEASGTIAVCRFHRLMVLSPLATHHGYAWADTLAHELVHLVVAKKAHNRVPVWLQEGLAKSYEAAWRDPAPPRLDAYPRQLLHEAARHDALVPLARMHPSMAKLANQKEAALAFAEVFSLVQHMNRAFRPGAMVALLDDLGRGQAFAAALARHFAPLAALERSWRQALMRESRAERHGLAAAAPPPLRLREQEGDLAAKSAPPADAIDDPNTRAAARLGELLEARGHALAAARSYEAAARLARGRYAAVTFRLARALVDARAPAAARDQLDQAVATGQLHDGVARVEGEGEAQWLYAQLLSDANQCPLALRYARAYNLQNPFNPAVHQRMAQCYAAAAQPAAAAREQRFAALAAAPRPPPTAAANTDASDWPGGHACLSVLPATWTPLQLDGAAPTPAPLWRQAVAPGRHCVVQSPAQGAATSAPAAPQCRTLAAQEAATLLF